MLAHRGLGDDELPGDGGVGMALGDEGEHLALTRGQPRQRVAVAAQSYLEALACTVEVARDRKTLKGFLGGVVVPAIRLDGWTFTGTTEH